LPLFTKHLLLLIYFFIFIAVQIYWAVELPFLSGNTTHSFSFCSFNQFYCPGKEAAMVIIVASPSCIAYFWGALIAL